MKLHDICDKKGCQRMGPDCVRYCALLGEGPQDDDEPKCGEPCDPVAACDGCVDYWQRMRAEGYWNAEQHRWTEKGWREIVK